MWGNIFIVIGCSILCVLHTIAAFTQLRASREAGPAARRRLAELLAILFSCSSLFWLFLAIQRITSLSEQGWPMPHGTFFSLVPILLMTAGRWFVIMPSWDYPQPPLHVRILTGIGALMAAALVQESLYLLLAPLFQGLAFYQVAFPIFCIGVLVLGTIWHIREKCFPSTLPDPQENEARRRGVRKAASRFAMGYGIVLSVVGIGSWLVAHGFVSGPIIIEPNLFFGTMLVICILGQLLTDVYAEFAYRLPDAVKGKSEPPLNIPLRLPSA